MSSPAFRTRIVNGEVVREPIGRGTGGGGGGGGPSTQPGAGASAASHQPSSSSSGGSVATLFDTRGGAGGGGGAAPQRGGVGGGGAPAAGGSSTGIALLDELARRLGVEGKVWVTPALGTWRPVPVPQVFLYAFAIVAALFLFAGWSLTRLFVLGALLLAFFVHSHQAGSLPTPLPRGGPLARGNSLGRG